ncbi:MAG: hypothetical protein ACYSUQ_12480 [Planctomycetota bacterium]
MSVLSRLSLLIGWVVIAATACAGDGTGLDDDNNGDAEISFADDVQPIFTISCALSGCHAGASPSVGMNLSAGQALQNIVNVASVELASMDRITPGEPDNSYLIHKIQGTQGSVGGVGGRMPLVGCCLSQAQIDTIRAWVEAGAENN